MVTIDQISPGTYQVDSDNGPRCIVVSLDWLNQLLRALLDARMIEQGKFVRTPPRR